MRTLIENYLHFMKNCIRPPYEKLKSLKSGFIENLNFENNRDPWVTGCKMDVLGCNWVVTGCNWGVTGCNGYVKGCKGWGDRV